MHNTSTFGNVDENDHIDSFGSSSVENNYRQHYRYQSFQLVDVTSLRLHLVLMILVFESDR